MPASTLPAIDLRRIQSFCERRVPQRVRHQVRIEAAAEGTKVTIFECRAPWDPRHGPEWSRLPVASLRYSPTHRYWTLFWADRNHRWHRYDLAEPTPVVANLLAEINRDPTGIFWG